MTTLRSSRRSFLTSTATALSVAPFILPAHVWAAKVPPSERLNLGFVGVGTQGRGLMGGFLGQSATQTVAVCDVDTRRRDHARRMVDSHYARQKEKSYKGCVA